MKKLVLLIVSVLFISGTFAQMRVNSSGQVSTSAGNQPVSFRVGNIHSGFTGSSTNNNVSFGFDALSNPLTANRGNTAIGLRTLRKNTTGNFNTATGIDALSWNTTGQSNTAFGVSALAESLTGSRNTAVGVAALFGNATGWGNTAIGYAAGANNSYNMHNTTVIGYWARATSNNEVRIGNNNITRIGGIVDWTTNSDGRTKRNIQTNVPGLDFINRLQPVTYNLDLDAVDNLRGTNRIQRHSNDSLMQQSLSQEQLNIIEQERAIRQRQIQSGFIAQDVAEVARNLSFDFSGVDVDEIGVYSLRYGQFVVPLVRAVQELSIQVEDLQRQLDEVRNSAGTVRHQSMGDAFDGPSVFAIDGMKTAVLHQNVPNPFSQSTQIRFYLPEAIRNASLGIFDLNGKLLKQIPLTQRGEGVEVIEGSQFAPGIYLYALIVDGREVDVKRMILTQ